MKQLEQFFHKHIIKFTLIVTLPLWAAFAFAEDFDYVETNTWIKHSESGYSFGTRQHIDKDAQQYMVRKDFKDTPYRLEYRNVHKGELQEHWQYTYSSGDAGYSHLQTYVGLEYKVYEKFTVVPYIEIDYDTSFTKDNAFFIVDFKFKL